MPLLDSRSSPNPTVNLSTHAGRNTFENRGGATGRDPPLFWFLDHRPMATFKQKKSNCTGKFTEQRFASLRCRTMLERNSYNPFKKGVQRRLTSQWQRRGGDCKRCRGGRKPNQPSRPGSNRAGLEHSCREDPLSASMDPSSSHGRLVRDPY